MDYAERFAVWGWAVNEVTVCLDTGIVEIREMRTLFSYAELWCREQAAWACEDGELTVAAERWKAEADLAVHYQQSCSSILESVEDATDGMEVDSE